MLPTQFPGRFGPFELESLLGRGGMARVYDGHRIGAHGVRTRVAIKCLLSDDGTDPRLVQMFIDEAKLNAQLRHPNLIAIHDFNEVDGVPYIAMEFVDGCDLHELIDSLNTAGERLPLPIVAELLRQLLVGLDYAHAAIGQDGAPLGLIHRDLKPANIFISREGVVKIGDFGIAKTRFSSLKTSTGMLKGTPAYLSPEQFKGESITPAVDFFALGLILYEMLSGTRYFQQTTLAALAGSMLTFSPQAVVMDLDEDAHGPFIPILEGLLIADPTKRFNQASDVLTALGPVFGRYPLLTPLRTWIAPHTNQIKGQRQLTTLGDIDLGTLISRSDGPPLGAIPAAPSGETAQFDTGSFDADLSGQTAHFDTGSVPGAAPEISTSDATANFGMESMAKLMMDPSLSKAPKPSPRPLSAPPPSHSPPAPSPQSQGEIAPRTQAKGGPNWPAIVMGGLLMLVLGAVGMNQLGSPPQTIPAQGSIETSSDLRPKAETALNQVTQGESEAKNAPVDAPPEPTPPEPEGNLSPREKSSPEAQKAPPARGSQTQGAPAVTEAPPQAQIKVNEPKKAALASTKGVTEKVEVALNAIPTDSRVSINGGAHQAVPWKGSLPPGRHSATFHCEGYQKAVTFTLEPGNPHRFVWNCPAERPYQPPGR